nr:hypothetical protein [Tanacetum cinerariifolium]
IYKSLILIQFFAFRTSIGIKIPPIVCGLARRSVISSDSVARASERRQLIIDELVDFRNSMLGINDTTPDEVSQVAVTIKAQENTEKVKVDVSKIPLLKQDEMFTKNVACIYVFGRRTHMF